MGALGRPTQRAGPIVPRGIPPHDVVEFAGGNVGFTGLAIVPPHLRGVLVEVEGIGGQPSGIPVKIQMRDGPQMPGAPMIRKSKNISMSLHLI